MSDAQIFSGLADLARIFFFAFCAYVSLVVLLRIAGKRTLSKLNAFDTAVTVAIGSILGATIVSPSVSLINGIGALVSLVLLQFVAAFLSVRNRPFARLIRAEPTLLLRDGEILPKALRRMRVTESELEAAVRMNGGARIDDVAFAFLEGDGSVSVMLREQAGSTPGHRGPGHEV